MDKIECLTIIEYEVVDSSFIILTLQRKEMPNSEKIMAKILIPTIDLIVNDLPKFRQQVAKVSNFLAAVDFFYEQLLTDLESILGRQCWATISEVYDYKTDETCLIVSEFGKLPSNALINRQINYVVTRKTTTKGFWTYNIYESKLLKYSNQNKSYLVVVGDYEMPTQKIIAIPISYFMTYIHPYICADSNGRYPLEIERATLHMTWRHGYHLDGRIYLKK